LAFSTLAPTPALGSAGEEAEMLLLVNGLRSRHGLRPVVVHPELRALANDWAQRMAAAKQIFHSPLDARVGPGWLQVGENVAVDLSVVAAERTLEASPEHLANLISPSYDYVGIGVAHGADGGIYVAQEFMQLAASSPKPRPAAKAKPIVAARRAQTPRTPPSTPPSLHDPSPPVWATTKARHPSIRLTDVFDRLRGLDADVPRPTPSSDYGLVRKNW
jgi:hypothetical protein